MDFVSADDRSVSEAQTASAFDSSATQLTVEPNGFVNERVFVLAGLKRL
jgi:hypothetical protein